MTEALADRFRAARSSPDEVVLEGFHALKHALRFGADVRAIATSDPAALERLAAALAPDLAGALRDRATAVDPAVLAALVPRVPATQVVAIAGRPRVDVRAALAAPGPGPAVLLEDPRQPGNVGAAVRVAAAAGAAALLTTGSRDPWEPAALRGAAGLHFALPVARVAEVAPGDRPLVALDPAGAPLDTLPPRALLAFGGERHGLGPGLLARADARVAIPMRPGVSSLNLATAVAVALYAARR